MGFLTIQNASGSWRNPFTGKPIADRGVTERVSDLLGFTRTKQGGSDLVMDRYQNPQTAILDKSSGYQMNPKQQQNYLSSYASTNTTTPPPGGNPPGVSGNPGQVQGASTVNNGGGEGGPSLTDQINSAYESEMGAFNQVESGSRATADQARTTLQGEADTAITSTESERGNRVQELGTRRQQVGLDVQSAGTRIKQMLSDLQNRNAAFLASRGGGAFESSLGAAVGERFGKTAMSEMGGLEGQRVGALNAISDEAGRVQTFYDSKIGEIKTNLQKGLANIGSQLQDTLNKISLAKGQSAQAKAAATMDAWNNYANWRSQLGVQALNLQQTLAQWALEKGSSLQAAQEYAVKNTPNINPSSFGVSAPNQPVSTGLITPTDSMSYVPQTGVSVSAKGGKKEEDLYPYLQTFT